MKETYKYLTSCAVVFLMLTACEEGFDELNTNPVRLLSLEPTYQLNYAIIESAPVYGNLTYETTIVKQMITPFQGVGTGGNLNQDNRSATQANWQDGYRRILKNIIDGIEAIENDPERTNLYNMLRIWRAHAFITLTDTYGDIPYTEAIQGRAEEPILQPQYTPQAEVSVGILDDLRTANDLLQPGWPAIRGDLIFQGNLSQWKKFANSLRLRLGMRLSEVNPAKAETEVSAAFAAGVMASLDDQPVFVHDVNFQNGNSQVVRSDHFFLHNTMVEFMKSTNDPRLTVYGGVYVDGDKIDVPVEEFYGLPLGGQSAENPAAPEAPLARINLDHFSQLEVPYVHMRYVEVELLLAEAAARGWIASDAAMHYEAGVTAGMKMWEIYPGNPTIADADIAAYLAANPYDGSSLDAALETINMQFWVSMFMNGFESYANYRRTNIPNLAPSTHPSRAINTVPLKMPYPVHEDGDNKAKYDPAVAK